MSAAVRPRARWVRWGRVAFAVAMTLWSIGCLFAIGRVAAAAAGWAAFWLVVAAWAALPVGVGVYRLVGIIRSAGPDRATVRVPVPRRSGASAATTVPVPVPAPVAVPLERVAL